MFSVFLYMRERQGKHFSEKEWSIKCNGVPHSINFIYEELIVIFAINWLPAVCVGKESEGWKFCQILIEFSLTGLVTFINGTSEPSYFWAEGRYSYFILAYLVKVIV